jgi:LSD1 subclass zinc finger protein
MAKLIEVRCKECHRLLGFFEGKARIQCPKSECQAMNEFDTGTNEHKSVPKKHVSMNQRTTNSGLTFR